MINTKAKYRMIDFSRDDGFLFISILYVNNNKNIDAHLVSRKNKNRKIYLPIKRYGKYIEISISMDEIFNNTVFIEDETWDIMLSCEDKKIEIDLDIYSNFMTDYYPLKERIYIVKPYITGFGSVSLFVKQDNLKLELKSFEYCKDITRLSLEIRGDYIKNLDSIINRADLLFKKRKEKISEEEYKYSEDSAVSIGLNKPVDSIISTQCSFSECFRDEKLPLCKNPLDGFLDIVDEKGELIELPLVLETVWDSLPYVKLNNRNKACWFKNYLNGLGICTNKL